MKHLLTVLTLFVLALAARSVNAQTPTVRATGLVCPDLLISGSPTVTGQINGHAGWGFAWSTSGSYTDFSPTTLMHIAYYNCNGAYDEGQYYFRVAVIGHEVGHALNPTISNVTSRADYIEKACTNEGKAAINNIVEKFEIKSTTLGYTDIGIAASNGAELEALYNAGGSDLAKRVGKLYCDNNITSTTHQNYNDYYGDAYDVAHPPTP